MLPPVAMFILAPAYCSSGCSSRLRLWPKMSSLAPPGTQALNDGFSYRGMSSAFVTLPVEYLPSQRLLWLATARE